MPDPPAPVFITRKFPPSVGGMETLSSSIWDAMKRVRPDAVLIAHGGGNGDLAWWIPIALARLCSLLLRRRASVVVAGDALTNAAVAPLCRLLGVRCVVVVHGLDMTYGNRLYRALVRPILRSSPLVISISTAVREIAVGVGVDESAAVVVAPAVASPPTDASDRAGSGQSLREHLGIRPGAVVLLTLGRLVPRKGVRWFVEWVLPEVSQSAILVVAGEGPDRAAVEDAAHRVGVTDRVRMLGAVDGETREMLLAGADLFVQPNVPVAGDVEGFGLVTVEATLRGTPVLGSDLEGISDALVGGEAGWLIAPQDPDAWVGRLNELLADPSALQESAAAFAESAAARFGPEAFDRVLREIVPLGNPTPTGPGLVAGHGSGR